MSSCGYWPGPPGEEGVFYAYAYPEPPGYRDVAVGPAGARWDDELAEFILPYEAVRTAGDPDGTLLEFFQRTYEAAILRTLGASTRLLAAMVAIEYSALGLLAGAIGAAGALALSWAVTRFLFDIPWRPAPGLLTLGVGLTVLLVAVVGMAASLDVLRRKPLGALRTE